MAARLSDADPKLSILIIEEGGNNLNDPTIVYPLFMLANLAPTSNATLFYQATAEAQLGGRELVVPSGGILGGGSSINLMVYSRAQRSDFDNWGTKGWAANDMIPYMKKVRHALMKCRGKSLTYIRSSRRTLDLAQKPLMVQMAQKKYLVEPFVPSDQRINSWRRQKKLAIQRLKTYRI